MATRHHGFTCPNCGSHFFGTYRYEAAMGDKYKSGTQVGKCNRHQHELSDCRFEWDRSNIEQESTAMYEQTKEEWDAEYAAFKRTLPSLP